MNLCLAERMANSNVEQIRSSRSTKCANIWSLPVPSQGGKRLKRTFSSNSLTTKISDETDGKGITENVQAYKTGIMFILEIRFLIPVEMETIALCNIFQNILRKCITSKKVRLAMILKRTLIRTDRM